MKRFFLKTLIAAIAVGSMGLAAAQDIKPRTIKFATQNPKGHPLVTGAEKFAELVSARSGGKLKVNVFAGGVLGGDAQNISALQGGTLEMMVMNSGILANVLKEFSVFDFPFMFANAQEADAVVDGAFGKMMHDRLDAKGIHGLAYWELGFRNITNGKRPITKVEDIAGLKLRVIPNAINVDWVTALGANPTPMAFPEVYGALENRAIDGQENPFTVVEANKLYEVQKYLAVTNHQYNPQSLIISKKFWDGLSADEKKIIADAGVEAAKFQRGVSREQSGAALDSLKKHGMQVTEFNAAELTKFREKLKPVIEKHAAIAGVDVVNALQAELAKLRK
ncbi:TRAP transporter substrate-binding protein [Curvibacter sp. RS43]|uniref:TRAP transporter substrate-binding protein n=1 Tax=Curvibacter microcysteis TaxID=3026419 RepID=A0ABT5M9R9_9BURK|nr:MULTISPECIES: TRAP transporter substrate-binding protein [unclassified Curvibacter]MDD0811576.1 TRAP transporter substrate-binding protein [Curvibacter sp. RS43]MDD0813327.1 TRAP transporter substrate-binding protein [Curvibacter sp. HBC28]